MKFPVEDHWVAAGMVTVLLLTAVLLQALVFRIDGLWHDEIYSLFVSQPGPSFRDTLVADISDSNPPLYYLLLSGLRRVWDAPPALLFPLLNLLFVAAVLVAIATDRRRRGLGFAAIAATVLLASGAGHFYLAEGRGYFLACCIAFLIALDAFEVAGGSAPARSSVYALAGIVASMTHVYGALVAGSIAAALVVFALAFHRRDVLPSALSLGIGAALGTLVWTLWAWQFTDRTDWIFFSYGSVRADIETVVRLTLGAQFVLVLFAEVVIAALFLPRTRPMAVVLVVAVGFIVALPLLVSLVKPIIQARYWMVAAPLVPAFLLSVIAAARVDNGQLGRGIAWFTLGVLLVTSILSAPQALTLIRGQAFWKGAAEVASEAASCPSGSVRTWVSGRPEFFPDFYGIASGLPPDRFVPVGPGKPAPPWPGPPCPIVGWAEHYPESDDPRDPNDPAVARLLLSELGLPADPSLFTIETHDGFWEGGFVVRRKQ